MIGLLIIGGITAFAAFAANKTKAATPATAQGSSSAAHPSNSGMDGIFQTPEERQLYSVAQQAVAYGSPARATIPIQPGAPARGLSALPPTLRQVLGVKPTPVATRPAVAQIAPVNTAPARAVSFSAPQRQRFSLL